MTLSDISERNILEMLGYIYTGKCHKFLSIMYARKLHIYRTCNGKKIFLPVQLREVLLAVSVTELNC